MCICPSVRSNRMEVFSKVHDGRDNLTDQSSNVEQTHKSMNEDEIEKNDRDSGVLNKKSLKPGQVETTAADVDPNDVRSR